MNILQNRNTIYCLYSFFGFHISSKALLQSLIFCSEIPISVQCWQFFGRMSWHGKFQAPVSEPTFQFVGTRFPLLRMKQGREVLFCQCILPIYQGQRAPVTSSLNSHFLYGKSQTRRNSSKL